MPRCKECGYIGRDVCEIDYTYVSDYQKRKVKKEIAAALLVKTEMAELQRQFDGVVRRANNFRTHHSEPSATKPVVLDHIDIKVEIEELEQIKVLETVKT